MGATCSSLNVLFFSAAAQLGPTQVVPTVTSTVTVTVSIYETVTDIAISLPTTTGTTAQGLWT